MNDQTVTIPLDIAERISDRLKAEIDGIKVAKANVIADNSTGSLDVETATAALARHDKELKELRNYREHLAL